LTLLAVRPAFHAAGSLRGIATEAAYQRGVAFSSAAWANALPVAEYTLAAVLAANKDLLGLRAHFRSARSGSGLRQSHRHIGNYRRVVGVVGASHIGRRVLELLRPFDLDVLVHDPYLDETEADRLGVRSVALDELCRRSHIVTLHAPAVPATHHVIDRRRLGLMRDGATLVNTARGMLVELAALTDEVLAGRLRLVDDVTEPPADSPLYEAPGAFLAPHIAGSYGGELARLGNAAVDELARYCVGLPFAHAVTREAFSRTA
jgi:phosphoglycerate dehydrogenase-like enzyme